MVVKFGLIASICMYSLFPVYPVLKQNCQTNVNKVYQLSVVSFALFLSLPCEESEMSLYI